MTGVMTNVVVSGRPDISDYQIPTLLVKSAALRFDITKLSPTKHL
jgi:hypothetical protein